MTPADVLARHRLYSDEYRKCTYCDFEDWPCDAVQLARQLAQSADALRAAEERAKTAEWLLVRVQQHIQETTGDEALLSWIGRELELAAPSAIPDSTGAREA